MLLYPAATLKFLRESSAFQTPASRRSLKYHLAQLQDRHPAKQVHRFTESDLREFCLASTFRGLPAPNTVRSKKANVSSFFAWATYVEMVPVNPAANLKFTVKPARGGTRPGHWLSEAQMKECVRACPETPIGFRDRAMLLTGFTMGLRLHEIVGLRWSKFSGDLTTVTFVGKGQKLATLGVPEQLRSTLEAWRQTSEGDILLPQCHRRGDTLYWDQPLLEYGARDAVNRAGERVGLKLDPHDLRRTFANILLEKGYPIELISKLLRHADIGTTQRYLEQNPNALAAVGQGLSFDL